MATRYIRAEPLFGSIGTSRVLSIPTSPATLITLGSGYAHIHLYCLGTGNLLYGGSGLAVNSGATLYPSGGKNFTDLQDSWQLYVRAESVSTFIVIGEYNA